MDIQYIGLKDSKIEGKNIICSFIKSPKDFDDFNVNIIDLSEQELWSEILNRHYSFSDSYINDFKTISKMMNNTREKIIILMPQNDFYQYGLKDYLGEFYERFNIFTNLPINLTFGTTQTKINNTILTSDFTFDILYDSVNIITRSIKGKKNTTISYENVFITTLNIKNSEELKEFMIETKIISENSVETPKWMEKVKMFDDNKHFDTIQIAEQEILEFERKIAKAQQKLNENKHLKSILYTQSDLLVEVVFKIIEELFGIELIEFEDKKIEDISFSVGDLVFIGEIKGITSNVKTTNLSQLDNHYTNYLEEHPEIPEENINKLLIINHQRKKPLSERDPIDHKQIDFAKNKYDSLIIETSELLKLLEKYRSELVTKDEIIELFTKNGTLKID